jgi:hypothetical protein
MLKAVIFDIDGTLVDSVDLHAQAWQEAFRHFGHDIPYEQVRHQIGKGGDQLMPVFLAPHELRRYGAALDRYRGELFKRDYLPRVRAFPWVRELFQRIRGVGLLGIIWGVWHWPIIWMGYNYPGQPVLGPLLMTGYTVVLAYFLAYAVFKSKGVWTAAYLHALNNQTWSFLVLLVAAPTSTLFAFGLGLPGLAVGALVCLLILRDPVWKDLPA